MNKKYIVRLKQEERELLEGLISKGKEAARKIKHANVLLKVDADNKNWTDEKVANAFSIHVNTVQEIRQHFVEEGIESALNRKKQCRLSRKPLIDGEKEAHLIALRCSNPPEGYRRWSLHLLADKLVELKIFKSISHETVRQALKKTS